MGSGGFAKDVLLSGDERDRVELSPKRARVRSPRASVSIPPDSQEADRRSEVSQCRLAPHVAAVSNSVHHAILYPGSDLNPRPELDHPVRWNLEVVDRRARDVG